MLTNPPKAPIGLINMGVSNQTSQPCVVHLPAIGIIEAVAIIEVAAIGWMTISLNTTLGIVTPILDAILNEDPVPEVLTLIHPDDILTGLVLHPDPTEGTDLYSCSQTKSRSRSCGRHGHHSRSHHSLRSPDHKCSRHDSKSPKKKG